ncbi:MAG: hypothetical protein ACK5OB_17495 [Pirellula sp.]
MIRTWLRSLQKTFIETPLRSLSEVAALFGLAWKAASFRDPDEANSANWLSRLLSPLKQVAQIARPTRDAALESKRLRRRHRLTSLPAVAAAFIATFLVANAWYGSRSIESRYVAQFESAVQKGEPDRARLLSNHILRTGIKSTPAASFEFCKFLAQEKDLDRANAIIDILAPNDAPGYPPAHEQRAIAYSNLMNIGSTGDTIKALFWHLNQAGQKNSEPILLAWATYYRLTGNWDNCVQSLDAASNLNPAHVFPAVDLLLMRGNRPAAERMLVRAKATALAKLSSDPLSKENRILLARIQARLGSADEAEQTLKAGLALLPGDKDLMRTMAALELAKYDKATIDQSTVEERIDQLLKTAATIDDPTAVFDRMVQIYQSSNLPEHRTRVREYLEDALKTDDQSALTHFVLSIIAVLEDQPERAIAYLERSLELAPNQHLVQNNLAWLLSKRTPPELDRALMLSQSAIESAPNIATYHDTLGSIFLLRGEYPEAVTELERALVGMPEAQRKNVHERLASAYRALGNTELADMHAARSQK